MGFLYEIKKAITGIQDEREIDNFLKKREKDVIFVEVRDGVRYITVSNEGTFLDLFNKFSKMPKNLYSIDFPSKFSFYKRVICEGAMVLSEYRTVQGGRPDNKFTVKRFFKKGKKDIKKTEVNLVGQKEK